MYLKLNQMLKALIEMRTILTHHCLVVFQINTQATELLLKFVVMLFECPND